MDSFRRMTPVEAKLNELIEEAYDALRLDDMLEADPPPRPSSTSPRPYPPLPPRPRPSAATRLLRQALGALRRAKSGAIAVMTKDTREAERLIEQALRDIPSGSREKAHVEAALIHVRKRGRGNVEQAIKLLEGVLGIRP